MNNIIFKGTAAQTAKANNAQKIDSKTVIDYTHILHILSQLDLSDFNNLHFSNNAVIEAFEAQAEKIKGNSYTYIALSIDRFKITIESSIFCYYVYDKESGKQKYRYYRADNARIAIFAPNRETAIFYDTYNPERFRQSIRFEEVEI